MTPRTMPQHLLAMALLGAVYYFAGKTGLSLATVHQSATVIWPPSGIALAAVLLLGPRVWPGIFVGAFLVNLTTAGNLATSAVIAAGNTLEPLVGAYLVSRFAGGTNVFDRARDTFKFLFFAAVPSTMISPTLGLTALAVGNFAPWSGYVSIWCIWWLGDLVSCLCLAPLILIWARRMNVRLKPVQTLESAALLVCLILVCGAVFQGWFLSESKNQPLAYLSIPFVVWAAFRFGRQGTITVCFFILVLAVSGTLRGTGPFSVVSYNESLVLVQVFMGMITVMGLVLAATISEVKASVKTLQEVNQQLQKEVEERQQAQAALAAHTRQLARSHSALEQFAHIASHDLQEPLRKIISFGDRLVESRNLSEEEKDYCQRMQKASYRMRKLIEDVLNFSRLSSEQVQFEPVDLKAVLDDVMADLDMAVQEAAAAIEVGELPKVRGNDAQLRHVFQNLISNAIKFRHPDKRLTIHIWGTLQNDSVVLRVRDNGIGFDPVYADRIFDPFKRLHGREYEGSGIGLAICQKIVHSHAGRIEVTSEVGKGTVFTMVLPAGRS